MSENIRSEEDLRERIDHLESLLAAAVFESPSRPPLPPPPSSPPLSPPLPPPPPASTLRVDRDRRGVRRRHHRRLARREILPRRRVRTRSDLASAVALRSPTAAPRPTSRRTSRRSSCPTTASPAPADPRQAATAAAAQLRAGDGRGAPENAPEATTAAAAIRAHLAGGHVARRRAADFDLDAAVTRRATSTPRSSPRSAAAPARTRCALLKLGASPHAAFLDKGALAPRRAAVGRRDRRAAPGGRPLDGKDARGGRR